MGFIVTHRNGAGDYPTYDRLVCRWLDHHHIPLENVPRLRGDNGDGHWLHVWDSEEDAKAFLKGLRKDTRDSAWDVQQAKGKPSWGPLRPLILEVSPSSQGWVFGLETFTELALQTHFPESCKRSSVFIGSELEKNSPEGERELRELAWPVLLILTSLHASQLLVFGSYTPRGPE